jgi:hypothetical protein
MALDVPADRHGMNSIAAYVIDHFGGRFFYDTFSIHLGAHDEHLLRGIAVLVCYWLILGWM